MERYEELIVALRRVNRATDMHSRQLIKTAGLTAPQLLILEAIRNDYAVTASRLAKRVSLSQATVTNILERLERRGLILRQRSSEDRRKVNVLLSEQGLELLKRSPRPFQETFIRQFQELPEWEQLMILSAVKKIAAMMNAETLDAEPYLDVDELDSRLETPAAPLDQPVK